MPLMEILIGLPASGKSTYAKKLEEDPSWVRINWDDMQKCRPGVPFGEVRKYSNFLAGSILKQGMNVVIDNTNLNRLTVNEWVKIATDCDATALYKHFDVPLLECIARDAARPGGAHVGRPAIERMALWADLIEFDPTKKLVLVDMDGTLADLSHRLHFIKTPCEFCLGAGMERRGMLVGDKMQYSYSPVQKCRYCGGSGNKQKDWNGFFANVLDDAPIEFVVRWVQEIAKDPNFIINIVSGRPEDKSGTHTVQWLEKYKVPYHHIFMRRRGDKRDDVIVKQEILDRLPKSQIEFVIDDRQRVCDMWRSNGLKVIQVAEGLY
jgi:predicted kinase